MADASHLERMGRELKCPICLSLLNSAASLTCNHVFCNSCIHASMKSAANCPVCKVPFRPREIRPAPQMDNLVNIYKSLEAASGVNIFVTQTETSTKTIGDENKSDSPKTIGIAENENASQKTMNESHTSSFLRASFPTKKRVQVQQHYHLESPPPTKLVVETGEVTVTEPHNSPLVNKGKRVLNERGELNICPFFWLREDIEKSSQQSAESDRDNPTDTPSDIPCFSDMKDSDDENPLEMSPKSVAPSDIAKNTHFFDSEMFEWTQRPCSPELLSSPLKLQVEDSFECEGVVQDTGATIVDSNTLLGLKSGTIKNIPDENGINIEDANQPRISSLRNEMSGVKSRVRNSSKTLLNFVSKRENGRKRAIHEPTGAPSSPYKIAKLSERCHIQRHGKKGKVTVTQQRTACHMLKRGKRIPKDKTLPIGDVALNSSSLNTLAPIIDNKELKNCGSKIRSKFKCAEKSKHKKQVTFSEETPEDDIAEKFEDNSIEDTQIPESTSNNLCMNTNNLPKAKTSLCNLSGSVLQKCQTTPVKIQCAFCHSAVESEESGLMVHYLNGKPITDHIGATKIISVHKNCAEWAPNVYFNDDDEIINLETELRRSRNISCSFCGVKGAALGCYEKTCRKSFHVPCAKRTLQCRWDYDNFVMLCPLHACHKLPTELPAFRSREKRKCELRNSCINQPQVSVGIDSHGGLWKSQSKDKSLVLCCSAISDAEKAIVSDFERLSGATVLKTWDPSVTHLIASTDENGACKRTFKFLMGVLGGKWILTIEWIKACLNAAELLDEHQYEIAVDTHGVRDGPRIGRLRMSNKQPKLFNGYKFYFMGDFLPSYKNYLHDLVVAAGGIVLNRKPVDEPALSSGSSPTLIVYSLELPNGKCEPREKSSIFENRRFAAEALARSTGSLAATNSWILNSIAGSKLQHLI
ncbi:hypothetical protein DM860_002082 [Cuscuta australis]|uniref:RING-type E3 ubiquitin transferase BRCA1 n=1 Tax=Cuscuta australis TaxID=267555 RepID=A0A328E028_9ASTE|nr:hypothetical protein DM860_002082 [Cuscuta australis]